MYAVEKIGSYISRGVYTVSGPFHPFGGAVDIIVVQQQDGSFKSSPWYVRFGKFQGVLKTKEKVVKISVNGVEAGFSMYLDHKGEAFFLRDVEVGGQDFFLSPPTSGDETEGRLKNGQFKRTQSSSVEDGQKELVTRLDDGNGQLVTRTSSRRSTIFGLVFGQKSIRDIEEAGNAERISSLERAEIAADLLEVKWSTNLTSGDRKTDDTRVKSSEKTEMNVSVFDKEQDPQTSLTNDDLQCDEKLISHGEGNPDDNFSESIFSGNFSEEAMDGSPSCLRVSEETIEIHTSDTGDNADQKNSEFVFRNPIVEPNLNFDGTFGDSFVSHVEGQHRNNILTEKSFEEITSHEEVVQIYALEISDTADRNKLISDLVTVQSSKADAPNLNAATYYDDTTQPHNDSHVGSVAGFSSFESGERELTSFSYCGTIESSTIRFNVSDDKPSVHLGLLSSGAEHCENEFLNDTDNMVQEVSYLSESGALLGTEHLDGCNNQNLETSIISEYYLSEKSQCDYPRNGAFKDSDNDGFNTESEPNSSSDQISGGIPFLYNQQLQSCEHEVIFMDAMAEESYHDKETNFQQTDFVGIHSQMAERDAAQDTCFPSLKFSNPLISGASAESHSIPEIPNSCNSSNVTQKIENFDLDDNPKRSYFFKEINAAGDFSLISGPSEVAEHSVPCSESSEDVQFPFSDSHNFSAKEVDTKLSNNNKVVHAEHLPTLSAEFHQEEQNLHLKSHKQSLEGMSDVLMSCSSPISIHGCKTSYGEIELSSISLPIICRHIRDLEGSDINHSLSCSLKSKADICKLDVLTKEDSSSSDLVAEPQTELTQGYSYDAAVTAISIKNEEEQKGTLTNATVELSLCKHLLFEGMGADAARQVFNCEKVNLEKFSTIGPSLVKNDKLVVRVGDQYFPFNAAAPIILGMICFGQEKIFEPQGMIPVDGAERKNQASRSITSSHGSWNLWPFLKRSKTISTAHTASENTKEMVVNLASKSTGNINHESDMPKANNSKKVQLLTPTSEELASLSLKEGKNVVSFTFWTPMLGLQQVDARIYLWKWNTRIVISDVDGTITKSDVLGQVMSLVGIDWSQTGVAHLFSAIKDNGYQLLFLSARAISQAHITRQFLFNLKQDGKALPDAPVVISPDGLFPSLYREVIRRAPHEFKISCLEAIKALFPSDWNPFYAGFGNRDTDEISYLKVGIPISKVFIINPKGQVTVNRRVDTRSYTSLHELVNGIFPPMSSFEQEDYNSWNYWKLPLPEVDI
ncbi:hypothetical protein C4D60_Mb10t10930 [Musa balbisiana]|uniref:phosphatidate phosphatase n=1 Tax=Musa balbisiana TaxID=52838 RepID=A0A4V4H4R6_MUSBA|nr:hypothetical protein C4D60_Mb10t10930 [Musa balbisiana]